MAYTIKNITADSQDIVCLTNNLITIIPSSGSINLVGSLCDPSLCAVASATKLILEDKLIVNNGSEDLSKDDSLKAVAMTHDLYARFGKIHVGTSLHDEHKVYYSR